MLLSFIKIIVNKEPFLNVNKSAMFVFGYADKNEFEVK
jgi:hypothetical protein